MSDTSWGLHTGPGTLSCPRARQIPVHMECQMKAGLVQTTALHRACFLAVQGLQMSDKKQDLAQSLPPEMPFTCITC